MKFKYRPEIDGLRAIAVLSVVIYHAGFQIPFFENTYFFLPGGFLGVDIFYVISGYLITFLIIERINNKTFTFREFYERRARRLLPVLFFVIISCLIAGWIFMLPGQFADLAGSALSSLFFLSNFWFYLTDSYFAEASSLKPLLHTWSLSIEEQFYLIFPPIIYLLFKKKFNKVNFIFILLILSSLLLSTFLSINNLNLNFYILPTRIWELTTGALIANYHINNVKINFEQKLNSNLFSIVGIIFIVVPFFLFNDQTPHPSVLTISTIVGTGILILNNKRKNFINILLSSKLFVGIGLLSYSLYLWHFPILAFKKIKSSSLSEFDKLEVIILAIIISIVSYFVIEKPFRNRQFIRTSYFLTFLFTFFIILLFSSLYIYKNEGVPKRYSKTIIDLIDLNYDYSKIYQTDKCHIKKKNRDKLDLFQNCKNELSANKDNIFLWGDSLAAHLYPGLNQKYSNNYNIFQRSVDGCKPSILNFENKNKTSICVKINEKILEEIKKIQPDKIFISGFWSKEDIIKIGRLITILRQNGISNIYLVGPSVRWHDPLPKILLKKYSLSKKIPKYLYDKNHKNNFDLDKNFNNFAKKTSINYLSIIKILCNENYKCLTKVGEKADSILTWDENHFTEKGSKFVFSKFVD